MTSVRHRAGGGHQRDAEWHPDRSQRRVRRLHDPLVARAVGCATAHFCAVAHATRTARLQQPPSSYHLSQSLSSYNSFLATGTMHIACLAQARQSNGLRRLMRATMHCCAVASVATHALFTRASCRGVLMSARGRCDRHGHAAPEHAARAADSAGLGAQQLRAGHRPRPGGRHERHGVRRSGGSGEI